MQLKYVGKNTGFTLIEVLIAMLILTIAMLGIASLHLVSLENSNSAYLRAQSVAISEDIIERIRHNPALKEYALNNDINSTSEFTTSTGSRYMLTKCTTTDGCDDDELALVELQNWANTLNRLGRNTSESNSDTPPVNVTIDYDPLNKVFDLAVNWEQKQWHAPDSDPVTDTGERQRVLQGTSYQFLVAIN